jgi:hypothetical protein
MAAIVKTSKNLFSCCPKELVLDGFLEWLFDYLNESENADAKLHLINSLFSVDGQKFKDVSDIKANRQDNNVDLMVRFKSQDTDYAVLFENKTWSSPHSGQLARYRDLFPNCSKYIYLKLAFIPYGERKEVERWDEKKHGYVVVTSRQLLDAIAPLRMEHPFIEEFYTYLFSKFVTRQERLASELFEDNNLQKLKEAEAQQYILSELHEKLDQHSPKPDLKFRAQCNSGGQAFTTLRIALNKGVFKGVDERIYWRIDKRSDRYYIRLTQYAKIDDVDALKQKKKRLEKFREDCLYINKKLNLDWKPGKLTNGAYESEIAIFFFDEDKNTLSKIRTGLEMFSLQFINMYSEFNQHS